MAEEFVSETDFDIQIDYFIIQLMKREKFMYDKRHPMYMEKKIKQQEVFSTISQAIYAEFEYYVSEKAIEKRWADLKKKYESEKRKLNKKPASGAAANAEQQQWVLFHEMAFLDEPVLKHRPVQSSMATKDGAKIEVSLLEVPSQSKNQQGVLTPISSKRKVQVLPPEDDFCKKKSSKMDSIDNEINSLKKTLKEAISNYAAERQENSLNTVYAAKEQENHSRSMFTVDNNNLTDTAVKKKYTTNNANNVYVEAIRTALKKVPNKNLFECVIKINSIIQSHKNV